MERTFKRSRNNYFLHEGGLGIFASKYAWEGWSTKEDEYVDSGDLCVLLDDLYGQLTNSKRLGDMGEFEKLSKEKNRLVTTLQEGFTDEKIREKFRASVESANKCI